MDKNKWIERKVKILKEKYKPVATFVNKDGSYIPANVLEEQLFSFLRQSLEEAWEKGRNDMHNEIWNSKTSETLERIEI